MEKIVIEKLNKQLESEEFKTIALLNVLTICQSGLGLVGTLAMLLEMMTRIIETAPNDEYKEFIRTKILEAIAPK